MFMFAIIIKRFLEFNNALHVSRYSASKYKTKVLLELLNSYWKTTAYLMSVTRTKVQNIRFTPRYISEQLAQEKREGYINVYGIIRLIEQFFEGSNVVDGSIYRK